MWKKLLEINQNKLKLKLAVIFMKFCLKCLYNICLLHKLLITKYDN